MAGRRVRPRRGGRPTVMVAALVLAVAAGAPAAAQTAPAGFVDEFMDQFEGSARKLVALAEAMPADRYAWRPAEGVATVSEVAMHIARYNLMYPEQNLGVKAPADMAGYGDWEETVTDKAQVVRLLDQGDRSSRRALSLVLELSAGPHADRLLEFEWR